jgi:hypothetical protein
MLVLDVRNLFVVKKEDVHLELRRGSGYFFASRRQGSPTRDFIT